MRTGTLAYASAAATAAHLAGRFDQQLACIMHPAAAECLHLAHARGLSRLHCWGRRRQRWGRLGMVVHYQSAGKAEGQAVLVNGFTHGHCLGEEVPCTGAMHAR